MCVLILFCYLEEDAIISSEQLPSFLFCNKNVLGPIFTIYGVGGESGSGREWALLRCTVTYICTDTHYDETTEIFYNEQQWDNEKASNTWH